VVALLTCGLWVFVASAEFEEPVVDFADHAFPAVAWTGDRLLVYGGADGGPDRYSNAAALIDPTTAEQDLLPSPPFDGALAVASLVADEEHALVLGWLCTDPEPDVESCAPGTVSAALLDLDSRAWSTVEVPDELAEARMYDPVLGVTTDGRAVFRFERSGFWTFDLANGNWKEVPFDGRHSDACLAGDRLVAATRVGRGRRALAIRSMAGGDWTLTTPTRAAGRDDVSCAGDIALLHDVFGEDPVRHSVDPADKLDRWRRAAPAPHSGGYLTSVWTGDELVFLNLSTEALPGHGPGLAYDPEADEWTPLDGAPVSSDALVWGDDAIVGFAPDADSPLMAPPKRLVRYVPDP
jgi:hypothetical protein